MSDEFTDPYATGTSVWDAYDRLADDEYAEYLWGIEQAREVEVVPDPRPVRTLTRAQAHRTHPPSLSWKLAVLERDQGCCVHLNPAECSDGFIGHHVVTQQVLRRSGLPDSIWHPSSGMGVCGLAHRQHHNRVRPILYM